jgi:hypothetical protein
MQPWASLFPGPAGTAEILRGAVGLEQQHPEGMLGRSLPYLIAALPDRLPNPYTTRFTIPRGSRPCQPICNENPELMPRAVQRNTRTRSASAGVPR